MTLVNAMLELYRAKEKVSILFRIKALNVLIVMLNKKWEKLDLSLDWRPFWDEMMSIIMRENRHELVGSDSVMVQHISKLASFISKARPYYDITANGDSADGKGVIYQQAEASLRDLRVPSCIEGPLLLMTCLPTKWDHYDAVLSHWMDLWSSINQNTVWDLCWSTIFSRAVKHTTTFNWKPYVPFFLQKIKELLSLPSAENRRDAKYSSFPRAFPTYYSFFFDHIKEPSQHILKKLTKVVVKIMMKDTTSVPVETSTITKPSIIEEAIEKHSLVVVGYNTTGDHVNETTKLLVEFLHMLRGFVHASNTGNHVSWIILFFGTLLRTVGKLLGEALADRLTDQPVSPWLAGRQSALFLSGYLLSMTFDGIYNKKLTISRSFTSCLKHILSLQPQALHLVCAFFMETLQPKAAHQPHQTTVALMALSMVVRVGLFPQPYLLQYIPDLLRLTMNFIEASDTNKTLMVLDLHSSIFGWLPLSNSFRVKTPQFPSYLHLLTETSHDTHPFAHIHAVYQAQYETILTYVTSEWAPLMFEKLFVLIDSEEVKVKGTKDSPIAHSIGYFVAMFFQSMEDVDATWEQSLERSLVQYILTRAPAHTDKTCGKLIEYYIGIRPHRLNDVLTAFLTPDFLAGRMSAEKLAFRLRVIGAVFRQCQGATLSEATLATFTTLVTNTTFVCHEEAKVRKHVGKVYKDLLKGGLSAYPVRVYARFAHNDVIGAPNVAMDGDIQWFVPTMESMRTHVAWLQHLTMFCTSQIDAALDVALHSNSNNSTTATTTNTTTTTAVTVSSETTSQFKKCEETIGSCLALLRRLIRGSAEILTEAFTPDDLQKIAVETGRHTYLSWLSPEQQQFIASYRVHMLHFLASVHEKLEITASLAGFSGLRNNEFIAKQWMKVFALILTRRVGFCKDVDKYRKSMDYQTLSQRIPLCAAVYARLKDLRVLNATVVAVSSPPPPPVEGGVAAAAATSDAKKSLVETLRVGYYWKRHDWNCNAIVSYIWIQHATRSLLFAQACNRLLFRNNEADDNGTTTDPVFTCLRYLLDLTRHSYDEIRPQARKIFEQLAKLLGPKLNDCITRLLDLLRQPTATYYQTASTLVTLKQGTMMRRIQSDVLLKQRFLESLPFVQTIASHIDEADKREKIMLALADCFVKYTAGWSVTPRDMVTLHQTLMPTLLDGFNANTTAGIVETAVTATAATLAAANGGGIRLETFNAFSLLHLTSSSLLVPPPQPQPQQEQQQAALLKGLVTFIQRQLTTAHGQPTQLVANALFYRLVESIHAAGSGPASTSTSRLAEIQQSEWFVYWQQCWNPCHAQGQWSTSVVGLLRMLALFANAPEDGKALWSRGVDEVLHAVTFLSLVKPRTFSKRRGDANNYSTLFSYGFASTVWTMCAIDLLPLFSVTVTELDTATATAIASGGDSSATATVRPSVVIDRLLNGHLVDAARHMGGNEQRVLNDLRAEIFAALLRFWFTHRARFAAVDDVDATGAVLAKYLREQTDAASSEFARDWQEALYFAMETLSTEEVAWAMQSEVVRQSLTAFRASLTQVASTVTTATTSGGDSAVGSDEGFSRVDKTIMMVNATLLALSTAELLVATNAAAASAASVPPSDTLPMAAAVREILVAPEVAVVLPYRTSRAELSMTVALLVDVTNGACDVAPIYAKLLAPLATATTATAAASTAMDVDDVAAATTTTATTADAATTTRQNAVEFATLLLARYWHRLHLRSSLPAIVPLVPLLLQGVTETRIDTVKAAKESLIGLYFALRPAQAVDPSASYETPLQQLREFSRSSVPATATTSHWRIREVAIRGTIMVLMNSWLVLSTAQRTLIKDILVEGLKDGHIDVQNMAEQGMVAYLAWKTDGDLQKIAEVYTRNSETLAARYVDGRRERGGRRASD